MDFWSRLVAGTSLGPGSTRRGTANDPTKRLRQFEKEYALLLQAGRDGSTLADDDEAAALVEYRLQELTQILADESRRPLPHPCIAFAAARQIYIPIAKLATGSHHEGIIHEAVTLFATLVESEEEAFVEKNAFGFSLTNLLVKITGANSIRLASDTEAKVIELAFNITTKIRLGPEILPAWFKPRSQTQRDEKDADNFEGRAQKQDFPLFYLLLDYIHHEGKVGDFARTGLLYIIESASSSTELEQWIVESDLSTLMATGLGALYSQLSRKLVIDYAPDEVPVILQLSDYEPPSPSYEVVSSSSPEFSHHLDTFLSHLLFWQDVLNHCKSADIRSTLLEHFQVIFLQQLLYPSLLESSDIDGGSSVAVLTYLRHILESLDRPDMINLILHYLLALPDVTSTTPSRKAMSKARKRKSMDLAALMASQNNESADPLLYNLVDLIVACLQSENQQTIHVTLQLASTIVRRHHPYAINTLLRTTAVHGDMPRRTFGAHTQEVDYVLSLAFSIPNDDGMDGVFESLALDVTNRLETHPCSTNLIVPKILSEHNTKAATTQGRRTPKLHTIRSDDPLLAIVSTHLESFFLNPITTNLAVTETVLDLATCGFIRLEGWLLRDPAGFRFDEDENDVVDTDSDASGDTPSSPVDNSATADDDLNRLKSIQACRRRPRWTKDALPRILQTLQTLSEQVVQYEKSIPRFTQLLQQRRELFEIGNDYTAMATTPQPMTRTTSTPARNSPGHSTPSRNGSPARSGVIEGFAQRIISEFGSPLRGTGNPAARSGDVSPHPISTAGTADTPKTRPRNSTAIGSPTPSSRKSLAPPTAFPPRTSSRQESPTRRSNLINSIRAESPYSGSSDVESDVTVASQIAAAEAIDGQILARRVGIPGDGGKASSNGRAVPFRLNVQDLVAAKSADVNDGSSGQSDEESDQFDDASHKSDSAEQAAEQTVSVSHVLTNTIILQNFLLELAALLQARASLFDEVQFV